MKKKIHPSSRIFLINKKYKKKEFYHYLKVPDVAIFIPKYKEKFLIVSQKREPINKITYEFPSGWVDKGESPDQSATRELLEETGYRAIKKPKKLISFYEEPGRLDSKALCFYSKELIKIGLPEKGIKIHLCSKKQMFKLIKKGNFSNGSHLLAFYYYLFKTKS